MARREKEVLLKAEAVEAAQRANSMAEARAADLEIKLQQCMADHDSLELRLEEANQASGMNQSHVHPPVERPVVSWDNASHMFIQVWVMR